jgi:hypothetical protein
VLLDWHLKDLRGKSDDEITLQLQEYLSCDRERGFSLKDAPLMRCALFSLNETTYRWIWSFHHILLFRFAFKMILIYNMPVTFTKKIQLMEAQVNHGTTSTTYPQDGACSVAKSQ